MTKSPVLGYHNLGEYHYFSAFPLEAKWLGEIDEGTIDTHASFLGFVTAVHESYHILQDLFLGACCLVATAKDDFATVIALTIGNPSQEATNAAKFLSQEEELFPDLVFSRKPTEFLLLQEMRERPELTKRFSPILDLKGIDLLECHAAILTELYIAWMLKMKPKAFNQAIVDELASTFRLPQMPEYNRCWKILKESLEGFIGFGPANQAHWLYPYCENPAEYEILAFLLEYALHVPPNQLIGKPDPSNAVSIFEDKTPTSRFLKLVYAYYFVSLEMEQDPNRYKSENKRSLISKELARIVNLGNHMQTAKNRGSIQHVPGVWDLIFLSRDQLLNTLNLEKVEDSFIEFDATTQGWLDQLMRRTEMKELFPRIYSTRITAMQSLLTTPEIFISESLLEIFIEIGLPRYWHTPNGLQTKLPSIIIKKHIHHTELESRTIWFGLRRIIPSDEEGYVDIVEIQGDPWEYLGEVVTHEIYLAMARSLFHHKPLQCPLTTERLKFYNCSARNPGCGSIDNLSSLPPNKCIAREIWEKNFTIH